MLSQLATAKRRLYLQSRLMHQKKPNKSRFFNLEDIPGKTGKSRAKNSTSFPVNRSTASNDTTTTSKTKKSKFLSLVGMELPSRNVPKRFKMPEKSPAKGKHTKNFFAQSLEELPLSHRSPSSPKIRAPEISTTIKSHSTVRRPKLPEKKIDTPREIKIPSSISMTELAHRTGVAIKKIIRVAKGLGERNIKSNSELTGDIAELIVMELNMVPILEEDEFVDLKPTVVSDTSNFPKRPPVVSVMGHVDHGKTSLLDNLRGTSVASKEHGGITQSIGAFVVDVKSEGTRNKITFIDTPGHAAFSSMREKGSQITDIVVLVVAADDGVRPQTEEVIQLVRKHNLPVVVAVTKCDKTGDDISEVSNRISSELFEKGLVVENLGGDVQLTCISSKTGFGMEDLKQSILLQSEIMDLRANADSVGEAVVIESGISRGIGPHADVLVNWGTLTKGACVVAGLSYGKIKLLVDQNGKRINAAGLSMPVRIAGLDGVVSSGDTVLTAESEAHARNIVEHRKAFKTIETYQDTTVAPKANLSSARSFRARRTAKRIFEQEREAEQLRLTNLKPGDDGYTAPILPLILRTDSVGVVDPIENLIATLPTDEYQMKIIKSGIGPVVSSDLDLAESTNAVILCFNTSHTASIGREAKQRNVDIRKHNVIYSLLDDVKNVLIDHLDPIEVEESLGFASILQCIPITTRGRRTANIAGCRVSKGKMELNARFRILRDNEIIQDGTALSMRHFKEKVTQVQSGHECGIQLDNFEDYQAGDVLECYQIKQQKQKIDL